MSDKETMKALFDACYRHGHDNGFLAAKICKLEDEIEHQKVVVDSLKMENASLRDKLERARKE